MEGRGERKGGTEEGARGKECEVRVRTGAGGSGIEEGSMQMAMMVMLPRRDGGLQNEATAMVSRMDCGES